MNKLWFKRKKFGWGWTPVSTEGWFVTLIYILSITLIFINADRATYSVSHILLRFALPFILITSFFIYICYEKGEKPKWSWGNKKED